jgi:hypothetical protein
MIFIFKYLKTVIWIKRSDSFYMLSRDKLEPTLKTKGNISVQYKKDVTLPLKLHWKLESNIGEWSYPLA